jgi:mRNA interferase RelE/StbE
MPTLSFERKSRPIAADPASFANNVTELRGSSLKRLRIGDFRVLFEETPSEIVVTKIGPRSFDLRLKASLT